MDLTDKGHDALRVKRAEITTLYENMNKQYTENKKNFHKLVQSFEWALPMMVTMGFTDPVMTYMLALSDAQYGGLKYDNTDGSDIGT